jgi:hypothetical protein
MGLCLSTLVFRLDKIRRSAPGCFLAVESVAAGALCLRLIDVGASFSRRWKWWDWSDDGGYNDSEIGVRSDYCGDTVTHGGDGGMG